MLYRITQRFRREKMRLRSFLNILRFHWARAACDCRIDIPSRIHTTLSSTWRLERGSHLSLGERIENHGVLSVVVCTGGSLTIGNRVYFNESTKISCLGSVEIGDETLFGPDVRIFDNNHIFTPNGVDRRCIPGHVRIGKRCWIASDVTILDGADIGDNCVIGAGCIIKETIPAGSLVTVSQEKKIRVIEARE